MCQRRIHHVGAISLSEAAAEVFIFEQHNSATEHPTHNY